MIVADTRVWIDFFNGAPGPARITLRGLVADSPSQLIIPDLVMFEVMRGFKYERQQRQALSAFQALNVQSVVDRAAAQRAAERYRHLRVAGVTVHSAVDVLVASYCIDHDLILLQRDRDFLPFEQHFGLRLLQPTH